VLFMTQSSSVGPAPAPAPSGVARHVSLLGSIRPYERSWLSRDVVAGITLDQLADRCVVFAVASWKARES
jgi:hypothetical protein